MNRGKRNRLHRKKRGIDMNQCAAAREGAKAYVLAAASFLLIHKLRRTVEYSYMLSIGVS